MLSLALPSSNLLEDLKHEVKLITESIITTGLTLSSIFTDSTSCSRGFDILPDEEPPAFGSDLASDFGGRRRAAHDGWR
jgi:hypothetical protein